jgi:hypothetical protein
VIGGAGEVKRYTLISLRGDRKSKFITWWGGGILLKRGGLKMNLSDCTDTGLNY